jgi:hypothetical protein
MAKDNHTKQFAILESIIKKNVEVIAKIDEKYKGFSIETPAENSGAVSPLFPDLSGGIGPNARNRP